MIVGIDVGSTTIKAVVLNEQNEMVFQTYKRHHADVRTAVVDLFQELIGQLGDQAFKMTITGSAGLLVAEEFSLPFVQEVVASTKMIHREYPDVDVVIELGGEDAKITYLGQSIEQRMNGVCAGGTGAFIDQMAILLQTDASGLNEMAKKANVTYPIASRCGVFAKSDIQPLLNEGTPKEDIAISVLQAVVNQTISGLACGKPIRGKIAFLGGPLHFLDQLRGRFIETLDIKEGMYVSPKSGQYAVAVGAAYTCEGPTMGIDHLQEGLEKWKGGAKAKTGRLEALFESPGDFEQFQARHKKNKISRKALEDQKGPIFVGIDAGSTTTKVTAINQAGDLVFNWYGSNEGSPLESSGKALQALYRQMPKDAYIARSAVTGYGEHLLLAGYSIDEGEIETVAHSKAANAFLPGVEFILDIGGQDMKCMRIKDGAIESIMLNEACSSGCGSFIETFAKSMNMEVQTFAEASLFAKEPVDLGTRCTVFMNSKVKQAQREGSAVGDISAGIAYSVIRNALYKVIRLRHPEDLGTKIVVQGGTFLNNAVLRSFEKTVHQEVVRPDIAGTMGAYGSALLALEHWDGESVSTIINGQALDTFQWKTAQHRCGLCTNRCLMTINTFPGGGRYLSGNRCERGAGASAIDEGVENLFKWKYDALFERPILPEDQAPRGSVGLPRVLNMFEQYPFWHRFFTDLGYRVVLSDHSSRDLFEKGMESIPSESVCYPGKLVHGHIEDLVDQGVSFVFYPSIMANGKEDKGADNQFNCPIVTSYPETIKANVDRISQVDYLSPFLPLESPKRMRVKLQKLFGQRGIAKAQVDRAVSAAYEALEAWTAAVRAKGEATVETVKERGGKAIVLSGRPYHIDPEINHGIPEMIARYGVAVLTEDAVAHLARAPRPLRVVDQWMFHTRLYNAASFVADTAQFELVQLNSFGCGLDAVTIDQVNDILSPAGKLHTVLKIDEINNLGAARIRIRSLLAVMNGETTRPVEAAYQGLERQVFTKEMKKTHTILAPQMSPIHFDLLEGVFQNQGYHLTVLPEVTPKTVETGLKVVHNDACYPSILVVGQIMEALQSGQYDLDHTAVMISQTGGGCRATNYIAFIRKALKDAGMEHIPVVSLNAGGLEDNPGFSLTLPLLHRLSMAMVYGDLLMRVLYRVRPYEAVKGSAMNLYQTWAKQCRSDMAKADRATFHKNIRGIVQAFDALPLVGQRKPRVGIVGEILVKFHPGANNDLVAFLENEGFEAVVPDLTDFILYSAHNARVRFKELAGSLKGKLGADVAIGFIESYRSVMKRALKKSERFHAPESISTLAEKASEVLSLCHQTGEGWFLTAEMLELLESDVHTIACLQPFACLPNHITGKGMIKALKEKFPRANIAAIDYDPGASEVNQINRLKLMLASAGIDSYRAENSVKS